MHTGGVRGGKFYKLRLSNVLLANAGSSTRIMAAWRGVLHGVKAAAVQYVP